MTRPPYDTMVCSTMIVLGDRLSLKCAADLQRLGNSFLKRHRLPRRPCGSEGLLPHLGTDIGEDASIADVFYVRNRWYIDLFVLDIDCAKELRRTRQLPLESRQ